MKFRNSAAQVVSSPALDAEYSAARAIGSVRVGTEHLFFRAGMRYFALEQSEIRRCYRRVMRLPMKMCCGSGNLDVEYLVVEGEKGELAQLQLPGTRAARALMEVLKESLPGVPLTTPTRPAEARA